MASNLCGTSGIQCDKCKGSMELINISGDNIASLGCEICRTKKTKDLDEGVLKKNFNHTSRFWCDEKFRLMNRKDVYPYEYMDVWENFEETSLPLKDAFYSRLNMKGISDTASLEYHGEKDLRLLSQYLLKNRCIAVSRCVRDISEYVLKKTTDWTQDIFTPHQVWHGRYY